MYSVHCLSLGGARAGTTWYSVPKDHRLEDLMVIMICPIANRLQIQLTTLVARVSASHSIIVAKNCSRPNAQIRFRYRNLKKLAKGEETWRQQRKATRSSCWPSHFVWVENDKRNAGRSCRSRWSKGLKMTTDLASAVLLSSDSPNFFFFFSFLAATVGKF